MSDTDPGHNRLAALAADIRAAHLDVTRGALSLAERAMAAGRMLIEAKGAIPHGGWADWLQANTGLSARTARRYMQLVKSGVKTATVADLGIKAAATKLARSRVPRPSPGHYAWGVTEGGIGLLIWPVGADRYHVVCAPVTAQFDQIAVTDRPVPAELLSLTVSESGFPIGTAPLFVYEAAPETDRAFEVLRTFGLTGAEPLAEVRA